MARSELLESTDAGTCLRVASLNLGGRNTNPFEFTIEGDVSDIAQMAARMHMRAQNVMTEIQYGPARLPEAERELIDSIVNSLFKEHPSSSGRGLIDSLLAQDSWAAVYNIVKRDHGLLFNALNLPSLMLGRPSIFEEPEKCRHFASATAYLQAWLSWSQDIRKKHVHFWREEAPKKAAKKGMDLPTAMAGLLVFDVMCLCAARGLGNFAARGSESNRSTMSMSMTTGSFRGSLPDVQELLNSGGQPNLEVPFQEIADFASRMPSSSFGGKHEAAYEFLETTQSHVLFAQEARHLASHPRMAVDFLPPFLANDDFTAVLLRRDVFMKAHNISADISTRLLELLEERHSDTSDEARKAWKTSASRVASVKCHMVLEQGGIDAIFVSAHCAQSQCTADFIESLRDALEDVGAELFVIGLDSNCSSEDVEDFQTQLLELGLELGCAPFLEQVTVAKQRTVFQTQVGKAGVCDISHKDYVLSWGPARLERGETGYSPDLCTAFGIQRQSKQAMRLPTCSWPFDHCGVVTSFSPPTPKDRRRNWRNFMNGRLRMRGIAVLIILLTPALRPCRSNPFGPAGTWHEAPHPNLERAGICKKAGPCLGEWLTVVSTTFNDTACFMRTPSLGHDDAQRHCEDHGGSLAKIESAEENRYVTSTVCPSGEWCWIGLERDEGRGCSWRWADGEEVGVAGGYKNWYGEDQLLPVFSPWPCVGSRGGLHNMKSEVCELVSSMSNLVQEEPKLPLEVTMASLGFTLLVSCVLAVTPRPFSATSRMAHWSLVVSLSANALAYGAFASALSLTNSLRWAALANNIFFVALWDGAYVRTLMMLRLVMSRVATVASAQRGRFLVLWWILLTVIFSVSVIIVLFLDITRRFGLGPFWTVADVLICVAILILVVFVIALSLQLLTAWQVALHEADIGCTSNKAAHLSAIAFEARWQLVAFVCKGTSILVFSVFGLVQFVHSTQRKPCIVRDLLAIMASMDSIINDTCVHLLAVYVKDSTLNKLRLITEDSAERAEKEVAHHSVAKSVLQAGTTAQDRLEQFALLEEAVISSLDKHQASATAAFQQLQALVQTEALRINQLMRCVRLRYMIMPLRFQHLVDIPSKQSELRQHVPTRFLQSERSPKDESMYLAWLRAEAQKSEPLLFAEVQWALDRFNKALWPKDLGLSPEEFPFMIWPKTGNQETKGPLRREDCVALGEVLTYNVDDGSVGPRLFRSCKRVHGFVVGVYDDDIDVHLSGCFAPTTIPRSKLRFSSGAGVFVPGPLKSKQRCLDKIRSDYEGKVPWPAAASVVDVGRLFIIVDDPYAIAVLIAYLRKVLRVVRVKNRFADDTVEEVSAQRLHKEFYNAQLVGQDHHARSEADRSGSMELLPESGKRCSMTGSSYEKHYRDVMLNVEVMSPNRCPIIGEIQVTLGSMAILKKSEQKVYTLMRMQSASEMLKTRVFSQPPPAKPPSLKAKGRLKRAKDAKPRSSRLSDVDWREPKVGKMCTDRSR